MPEGSTRDIPDAKLYRPLFSPWFGGGDRAFREIYEPIRPYSLVSSDRSYVLYTAARQAAAVHGTRGEWWECGVYKGGTAMLLAALIERVTGDTGAGAGTHANPITLRLFVNPLVTWIWVGGAIVVAGAAFAIWPRRRPAPVQAAEPVPLVVDA